MLMTSARLRTFVHSVALKNSNLSSIAGPPTE